LQLLLTEKNKKGERMCIENLKQEIEKLSNKELNELVKIIDKNAKKSVAEVVFAGTLSNGKSMVVNALIGQGLLPSSAGSTTANLFIIKKGDENKIVSYLKDKIKEEYKLTPEKLEELNNKKYDKIEIYLKDFPYNNVAFVDTPGINDIDEEREIISLEYVPLTDAVVFVLDIAKGLTKKEKEFFENKILKSHKDKIFILLNKLDTIKDEGNIPEILKDYQISKVSALDYLGGILSNKKENIKRSNFL
jgi:predicted GTPase